ncbi:MAG: retropepsin-like aspartic protease [Candidatus Omnitrophota bacterium]
MKISVKTALFFIFFFSAISGAGADTVYLKNGRQIKGIIKQMNDEFLELGVGSGTVKFYLQEILRVKRSSQDENQLMKGHWDSERLRKEEELKTRRQQEEEAREAMPKDAKASRRGDHLFVNALLNKKVNARLLVDTGASFVVLSPAIVKKLNINTEKKDSPQIKITVADGREILGKYFKLESISIGEATAEGVDASIIFEEDAFTDFDGILGMSFLKLFKFAIDLDGNRLILQK